jgi:hypothetical protein
MRISKKVIKLISDKDSDHALGIRKTLEVSLHFSEYWMNQVIKRNKTDGPLTLEKSLRILEKALNMKRSEILEVDPVPTRA